MHKEVYGQNIDVKNPCNPLIHLRGLKNVKVVAITPKKYTRRGKGRGMNVSHIEIPDYHIPLRPIFNDGYDAMVIVEECHQVELEIKPGMTNEKLILKVVDGHNKDVKSLLTTLDNFEEREHGKPARETVF